MNKPVIKLLFHGPVSGEKKEICMIHAETDDQALVLSVAPKAGKIPMGPWKICPVWINKFAMNIRTTGSHAINFFEAINKPNPFINKDGQKIWFVERSING